MHSNPAPLQDTQFFENFYEHTHLIVFRFIFGLHGGPIEDVEDLTADTFMRAWKARHRFSGDDRAALGWLLQIARNLVIDAHRRTKVRADLIQLEDQPETEDQGPVVSDYTPDLEEQVFQGQQIIVLEALLLDLPVEQREMVLLRYMLGWQVKEIANHLGLLENTVSVSLRRAIQRMRQKWPKEDG